MLQEVYVRMHRALFRAQLLPLGGQDSWGNFRVPASEPAALGGSLGDALNSESKPETLTLNPECARWAAG